MLIKDKVVIVSGIGPGLGQELSTLSAAEGASAVVLAARTPAKLDAAEQEIRELGQRQGELEPRVEQLDEKLYLELFQPSRPRTRAASKRKTRV